MKAETTCADDVPAFTDIKPSCEPEAVEGQELGGKARSWVDNALVSVPAWAGFWKVGLAGEAKKLYAEHGRECQPDSSTDLESQALSFGL